MTNQTITTATADLHEALAGCHRPVTFQTSEQINVYAARDGYSFQVGTVTSRTEDGFTTWSASAARDNVHIGDFDTREEAALAVQIVVARHFADRDAQAQEDADTQGGSGRKVTVTVSQSYTLIGGSLTARRPLGKRTDYTAVVEGVRFVNTNKAELRRVIQRRFGPCVFEFVNAG